MSELSSNKTIAKNTILTYVRMFFNLIISLYTSRIILQVLGVNDLGVYQVVGGIVAIFTFIGSSMAGANSRFLAYELPKGNIDRLRQTFSASLNANIFCAIIFFILAETVGLWIVLQVLVIPPERTFAAMIVYQFSIATTCLTITQYSYQAALIAHEKINIYAYIGIIDTILKLIACYLVLYSPYDKLISYAFFILTTSFLLQGINWWYCRTHFAECRYERLKDWKILKPMLIFSGWDLFNGFCFSAKQQGQNILLNMFFSVAINAACGFSNSIYGAIRGFANNFMVSVRPVITKAYSLKDYNRMEELITDSSKFSFSLILLFSLPFFFEGKFIITLWLKNPPEWTISFCQMQLLICLISVIFTPLTYGIMATGKNKIYNILDGVLFLMSLPVTYVFLRLGYSPLTPFLVLIFIELIKSNFYAYILKKNLSTYNIKKFYNQSVWRCIYVFTICICLTAIPYFLIPNEGWFKFISILFISTITVSLVSYRLMLSKHYRKVLLAKLNI